METKDTESYPQTHRGHRTSLDFGGYRKFCVNRFERSSLLARIVIELFESERKIFHENNTEGSH